MLRCAALLSVTLIYALALDTNRISSSREPNSTVSSQLDSVQNSVRRRSCSSRVCEGQCAPSPDGDSDDIRTRAAEMTRCVRSRDCADGLCCARYLTGRRCQRIPGEGDACLARGAAKVRRKLGRCDCDAGLTCEAPGRSENGRVKGQGVCTPKKQGQRKTRHSGKRRKTAEGIC